MEQRGVNETDVRGMLERAAGFVPATTEGRFVVRASSHGRMWTVILEPDAEERRLVVVTVFEQEEP